MDTELSTSDTKLNSLYIQLSDVHRQMGAMNDLTLRLQSIGSQIRSIPSNESLFLTELDKLEEQYSMRRVCHPSLEVESLLKEAPRLKLSLQDIRSPLGNPSKADQKDAKIMYSKSHGEFRRKPSEEKVHHYHHHYYHHEYTGNEKTPVTRKCHSMASMLRSSDKENNSPGIVDLNPSFQETALPTPPSTTNSSRLSKIQWHMIQDSPPQPPRSTNHATLFPQHSIFPQTPCRSANISERLDISDLDLLSTPMPMPDDYEDLEIRASFTRAPERATSFESIFTNIELNDKELNTPEGSLLLPPINTICSPIKRNRQQGRGRVRKALNRAVSHESIVSIYKVDGNNIEETTENVKLNLGYKHSPASESLLRASRSDARNMRLRYLKPVAAKAQPKRNAVFNMAQHFWKNWNNPTEKQAFHGQEVPMFSSSPLRENVESSPINEDLLKEALDS